MSKGIKCFCGDRHIKPHEGHNIEVRGLFKYLVCTKNKGRCSNNGMYLGKISS